MSNLRKLMRRTSSQEKRLMNETIHIGHVIQPISIGHDIGNLVAHNIVM